MIPVISTTHAVPQTIPSSKIRATAARSTCPYCLAAISPAVRILDAKGQRLAHNCPEKMLAVKPSVAVPFS
jgi:hypothetical protein